MNTKKNTRTRTTANTTAGTKLTIREITESKDGYEWQTFLVQGWKENGRWQRRKFSKRDAAVAFVATKQVELLNGQKMHHATTRLSSVELEECESAFSRLGERYTITQAVDYFLAHFTAPDFQIVLSDAIEKFVDGKRADGVRERSIQQLESTLGQFQRFMEDCEIHTVASGDVERFLKSLRAKDGVNAAARKTWNNYRADIHSFFSWCGDPRRRWINENPASRVHKFKKLDRGVPQALTVEQARDLMAFVHTYKGGRMTRYFALALFAGIRPGPGGELHKMAHCDPEEIIDLKRGVIHIRPEISKTGQYRQVAIRPNLRRWLQSAPAAILPDNYDRDIKHVRSTFSLGHDVLRHSFFSAHVAAFRSVGDAAIEGGNTEAVVKKYYLNLMTQAEGKRFWEISPASPARNPTARHAE